METAEQVLGAFVLANLGLVWRIIASAKKSSEREARQSARLDALEKDMDELKERHDSNFDKLFHKMDELREDLHKEHDDTRSLVENMSERVYGIAAEIANMKGELRGRGVLNGRKQ